MMNSISEGLTQSFATVSSSPAVAGGGGVGLVDNTQAANVRSDESKQNDNAQSSAAVVSVLASNMNMLQTVAETNNTKAVQVRQLDTARAAVDGMRENLAKIVKMYPPYAKDDPERAKYMSSVSGLRQVTEQLEIPPDYEAALHDAISLPGVQGVGASDGQIADALTQLDQVSSTLQLASRKLFDSAALGGTGTGAELAAQQASAQSGAALVQAGQSVTSGSGRGVLQALNN